MAGLLDFMDSPGAAIGLGLLAAGGPTTDPNQSGFGQSLARGVQMGRGMQDQQDDRKLKQAYLQGQIDAQKRAELEYQDKKSAQAGYFSMLGGSPGAAGASVGGAAVPMGGASGPAQAVAGVGGAPVGGGFNVASLRPEQVLAMQAYAKSAGLPDPTEVWKAARPDMQVSNGYAYNKNAVQAGYLPQLNVSRDGQSTLVQIGPDGLPVISAPRGAVDTARAYADVGDRSKANYDLVEVKGADGRTYRVPRAQVVNEASGAASGAPSGGRGDPPASAFALQTDGDTAAAARGEIARMNADLASGKVPDAASQKMMREEIARLTQQLAANPAAQGAPGNVADFSPAEKAKQEAEAERLKASAKADVVRDTGRQTAAKQFDQMTGVAKQAMTLLDAGPTGSGAGALADSALNFIGQPTKSGNTAQSLEALSGWMTANIPRMEGPQSDADVRNYQTMAGRVGDRTLPVETRKQALQEVVKLQNKYAAINGGDAGPGDAQPPSAKLKAPPSQSDLQNTALKYGITVDEVKKRLGVQ